LNFQDSFRKLRIFDRWRLSREQKENISSITAMEVYTAILSQIEKSVIDHIKHVLWENSQKTHKVIFDISSDSMPSRDKARPVNWLTFSGFKGILEKYEKCVRYKMDLFSVEEESQRFKEETWRQILEGTTMKVQEIIKVTDVAIPPCFIQRECINSAVNFVENEKEIVLLNDIDADVKQKVDSIVQIGMLISLYKIMIFN
jgi:hypothetical protein